MTQPDLLTPESAFTRFWKAYPRKVSKPHAQKAWRLNKCDAIAERVIAALDAQKPLWKDPQFIPYPATWLNGRRWEDEIAKPYQPKHAFALR